MDWAINVELQFTEMHVFLAGGIPQQYVKDLLDTAIRNGHITHYHLLSDPEHVEA